jgi:4-hydroxythreonine-4-phosphate dehydrogenase
MSLPIIGITMGDPTGIGPEIIAKAFFGGEPFQVCRPVVFGDQDVLQRAIDTLGLEMRIEALVKIPEEGYHRRKVFLVPVSRLETETLRVGKPDRECGEAMARYIEEAVKRTVEGTLDAITTCPINKQAINKAGYPFSGHTEFLAHLTGAPEVAMMFVAPQWKVVLVTTHLPLHQVSKWITKPRILSKIRLVDEGLKQYFGMHRPRVAVLGLNPHCGEENLLGEEETREIVPAIQEARSYGIDVEGPFPADSFFNLSRPHAFDTVVAMYHDQGLIPIKMVDFRDAVNLTLGLPFIRTSVAHGTAYDIAGKGTADSTNLVKAIEVASKLLKLKNNRARRNPEETC